MKKALIVIGVFLLLICGARSSQVLAAYVCKTDNYEDPIDHKIYKTVCSDTNLGLRAPFFSTGCPTGQSCWRGPEINPNSKTSCGWVKDGVGLKLCVTGIDSSLINFNDQSQGGSGTLPAGKASYSFRCSGGTCAANFLRMIVEAGGGGGGAQSFDAGPAPVALNADGTYYSCALITGFAQNFRDMINTIIQTQGVGCSLAGIVDGATSMGPAIKVELSGNATACSNIAKAIKTQITGSFVVGGQTMCNDVIEYTGEASVANDPTKTRNEVGNKFDFCRQVPGDALDSKSQRSACLKCLGNSGEFADSRIYTAVGCLQTSNEGLVRDLVRLLMGVSGTVALLSILGGAFMLSISQGDTNKVKQGRELIMAAVGGLVFMIFSIIILQFVGVSLLHIPGLSQ